MMSVPNTEELPIYAKYFIVIACMALFADNLYLRSENKTLNERLLNKEEGEKVFYKDAYFNLTKVLKDE